MPSPLYDLSARLKLRLLKGTSEAQHIDEGIHALGEDIDALLYQAGDLRLTARTVINAGWLVCEGQAVSRATYKALFEAIGTAYGEGDKATTFNVPDYRGRTPIGSGTGPGLTARAVGQALGEEKHLLTTGEMPAHTHSYQTSLTSGSFSGSGSPALVGTTGATTGSTGGGETHNNMQPSTVCNVWIRT